MLPQFLGERTTCCCRRLVWSFQIQIEFVHSLAWVFKLFLFFFFFPLKILLGERSQTLSPPPKITKGGHRRQNNVVEHGGQVKWAGIGLKQKKKKKLNKWL